MFAIEQVVDEVACALGRDPLDVREANFYGAEERNVTPYGMTIEDNVAPALVARLAQTSRYRERRREIRAWNRASPVIRRGIALTPVKFGISFTATHYNQAAALVHVYKDGTVLLNHGGTEMGQGLFTKVRQVVARELGIALGSVRVTPSDTSKVANASPTAASSGSDLNGMAARDACAKLRSRLADFAAKAYGGAPDAVKFAGGEVRVNGRSLAFAELCDLAYHARVRLSASGFYATPKIHYDRRTLSGRPFFYFAYGAAVSEVEIDTLTGEHRLLAVDILHDAGESLNPAIDLGQIEGGFLQGYGWLAMEEIVFDERGALRTHAPSTYKIPASRDWPDRVRIDFWHEGNREDTIYRSKAVGEPPFMLALSAFHAIRDAVASVGDHRLSPRLDAPASDERILVAIEDLRARARPAA
jgi:xanthine dehydrogenase large subunit